MTYSSADLDRRFQLGRELLSTHELPVLTKDFLELRLSGPGRHLSIPFPQGLEPKPSDAPAGNPESPLPKADIVVLTYTSDEAKALADVLTPGKFSSDWTHYTRNFNEFLPKIRKGAPARMAGRLASYAQTTVGTKKVLVVKSELHMHQDVTMVGGKPTLPIRDLFRQIISEAKPDYFFPIGTAGGVYPKRPLGTIVASRSAQFMCEKDFKNEPYAKAQYKSDWNVPRSHHAKSLELMKAFVTNLQVAAGSNLSDCPCKAIQGPGTPDAVFLMDGHDGIPAFHPVLTTDFFEFGTDKNHLDKLGVAVEMDDAALGLACTDVAHPPKWASIRNYSDPTINGDLGFHEQEACASKIYLKYGYWTSVLGGIATWSVMAG